MAHEAVIAKFVASASPPHCAMVRQNKWATKQLHRLPHILCDAFQHASRLENEGGQDDTAQVSTRTELGYDVQEHYWDGRVVQVRIFLGCSSLAGKGKGTS